GGRRAGRAPCAALAARRRLRPPAPGARRPRGRLGRRRGTVGLRHLHRRPRPHAARGGAALAVTRSRTSQKRPASSENTRSMRRPALAASARISTSEYLYESSVWISSPAANAISSGTAGVRPRWARSDTRDIDTRPPPAAETARLGRPPGAKPSASARGRRRSTLLVNGGG